jgi:hypothetical protein
MTDPVSAGIGLIGKFIDKFVPDKDLREKLKAEAASQEFSGELQIVMGQLAINAEEAKHQSVFVSGWRPGIGWVGVAAMTYQFILYPLLTWIWAFGQGEGWVPVSLAPPPILAADQLWVIITGILGIGGMRTFERYNGVIPKGK